MLTNYTSYDEIRAILGVSQLELEDATLALGLYERLLEEDLIATNDGLIAQYDTVAAIAEGSRTPTQQKYYDVIQLFSAYSTARHLLSSLQYFAANQITDGRAAEQRVADPYSATRENVERSYGTLKARALATYGALGNSITTAATRVYAEVATLGTDPVTGV